MSLYYRNGRYGGGEAGRGGNVFVRFLPFLDKKPAKLAFAFDCLRFLFFFFLSFPFYVKLKWNGIFLRYDGCVRCDWLWVGGELWRSSHRVSLVKICGRGSWC